MPKAVASKITTLAPVTAKYGCQTLLSLLAADIGPPTRPALSYPKNALFSIHSVSNLDLISSTKVRFFERALQILLMLEGRAPVTEKGLFLALHLLLTNRNALLHALGRRSRRIPPLHLFARHQLEQSPV